VINSSPKFGGAYIAKSRNADTPNLKILNLAFESGSSEISRQFVLHFGAWTRSKICSWTSSQDNERTAMPQFHRSSAHPSEACHAHAFSGISR